MCLRVFGSGQWDEPPRIAGSRHSGPLALSVFTLSRRIYPRRPPLPPLKLKRLCQDATPFFLVIVGNVSLDKTTHSDLRVVFYAFFLLAAAFFPERFLWVPTFFFTEAFFVAAGLLKTAWASRLRAP